MSLRSFLAGLALLLALGPGRASPAAAADPFYESLMETGISAHARGDFGTAARNLRVASFGLLEEPERLAECLAYLALAQGEIADGAGLTDTVDRLLEVERRFQAFSELDLDAGLRQALEGHLMTWIPAEVLDRSGVFRDLGRRKRLAEIRGLPAAERRVELERRVAAEPDFNPWRLLLAELDFAEGDFAAVLSSTETLLQQDPGIAGARCLRGRSGAALGLCDQAVLDLEACDAPLDNALLEERLRCHLALGDFDAASGVLDQVSADDRQGQPFRQLARELERRRAAAAKALAAARRAEVEAAQVEAAQVEAAQVEAAQVEAAPPETAPALHAPNETVGAPPAQTADAEPPAVDAPLAAGEPPAVAVEEIPADGPPVMEPSTESVPPEAGPAEAGPPIADRVRTELRRLEALVETGSRAELEAGFEAARALADSHPRLAEPQHLAAVIAYRLSRWEDVVSFTRRGGEPDAPDRQFYLSVALFEAGDRAAAKEMLQRCLPRLEPTSFVRGYAEKILSGG